MMKFERIDSDAAKVFISDEELKEKDMSRIKMKLHCTETDQFFYDIIQGVWKEFRFREDGHMLLHVYLLPCYGVLMRIQWKEIDDNSDDEEIIDHSISIHVQENSHLIYEFSDFEDLIQVCKVLGKYPDLMGRLHLCDDRYFVEFTKDHDNINWDTITSIIAEYGEASFFTVADLQEYPQCICTPDIIKTINTYFH